MSTVTHDTIETLFQNQNAVIARDLKLNLTRLIEDGSLPRDEVYLVLVATATSVEHRRLAEYAAQQLRTLGIEEEKIREARESAALMGMLNTYYRFRHFVGQSEDYRNAGLRMTALARPILGKERFEMLAFAVSVLNGCETCTRAHEKTLKDAGVSPEKIHDLARIASVVKGMRSLSYDSL
jgi:alkyl hydroperoxide reductase subunit D